MDIIKKFSLIPLEKINGLTTERLLTFYKKKRTLLYSYSTYFKCYGEDEEIYKKLKIYFDKFKNVLNKREHIK